VISLPDNTLDLKRIKGVGKKTLQNYGKDLVSIVSTYRKKHGIEKVILPRPREVQDKNKPAPKESTPSDTKLISFNMFNKGMPVPKIAKERGLVESTIQGHLCFFVENGKLDIARLISPERQQAMENILAAAPNHFFKTIKTQMGNAYSYGEIKLMLAHQSHLASK
jgi:uncharacterized protein YpbB